MPVFNPFGEKGLKEGAHMYVVYTTAEQGLAVLNIVLIFGMVMADRMEWTSLITSIFGSLLVCILVVEQSQNDDINIFRLRLCSSALQGSSAPLTSMRS